MFVIRNNSNEVLILTEKVDTSVDGCRLVDNVIRSAMRPDDVFCITSYEPGVVYTLEPANNPATPRVM